MAEIGLFYGSTTGDTQRIAGEIQQRLGNVDVYDIGTCKPGDILKYDTLILGVSSWSPAVMQEDWNVFLEYVERMDLRGKTVALYGTGDQENYSFNFADALGRLHNLVRRRGANIVGATSTKGYTYFISDAEQNGRFVGLVLDDDTQPEQTLPRINAWVRQLQRELPEKSGGGHQTVQH